ncbi:MAG: TetR/AcrR family transcriptional regulator, partial [Acidimicrobiales bacterium]
SQTQQERKTETRSRLLAAAADLFAEQGIDAVSIDAVADAAGRTSGSVYAHFGSKQGLLLALLDSWKDSVLAVLLAEVAVSQSPRDQLAAVWDNVAEGSGTGAGPWHLLEHELWLRAARDPEIAAILRARSAEARRFSARHLAEWTAVVGARPPADPAALAVLVRALLIGLAMQRTLEPEAVSDELVLGGLSALLGLDGPGARADGRRPPSRASAAPRTSARTSTGTAGRKRRETAGT